MAQDRLNRAVRQHLAGLHASGVQYIARPLPNSQPSPSPEPTRSSDRPADVGTAPPLRPTAETASEKPSLASPKEADSLAARRLALELLAKEIEPCSRCQELFATRTQTVFGVGRLEPDICFVGEAPGADEDRQGEPFVGAAGQLLNKIIAACGYRRDEVYICNILKCRPPGNRTPTPQEADNCRDYLERQIELVRPRYLVALGGVAAKNLLQTNVGISKLRGRVYQYKNIPLICTFHPSYLLRMPAAKKDCWEDMKFLLRTMGKPIPNNG